MYIVGTLPLSSSTPVRRSSPRLLVSADGYSETVPSLSSPLKSSYTTRRSVKRTAVDDASVHSDISSNLTSLVNQSEHRRQLRNSVIKSRYRVTDVAEASEKKLAVRDGFISTELLTNDDKLINSTEQTNPPQRRKRGWPKGVPRKKRVSFLELIILL